MSFSKLRETAKQRCLALPVFDVSPCRTTTGRYLGRRRWLSCGVESGEAAARRLDRRQEPRRTADLPETERKAKGGFV